MILTENRKGQVESEVEIEDLLGSGMWNSEVPGLAKDVQLMVTIRDSQEIAVVHCRGHQSQILRSEIGKVYGLHCPVSMCLCVSNGERP